MQHTRFAEDIARGGAKQERIDLDLPPIEVRVPRVVDLQEALLAEAAEDMTPEELSQVLDEIYGLDQEVTEVQINTSLTPAMPDFEGFEEEDAFFAEMNDEEERGDEIIDLASTETYLSLSTCEDGDCIPISEEDLAVSGLHRFDPRRRGITGTLRHDLRHEPSARILNTKTGIQEDDYEGMSSQAADQAIAIRDIGF